MRYIDLFVRDHPELDAQRAIEQNCPSDFGYRKEDPPCAGGAASWGTCRACWEREVQG